MRGSPGLFRRRSTLSPRRGFELLLLLLRTSRAAIGAFPLLGFVGRIGAALTDGHEEELAQHGVAWVGQLHGTGRARVAGRHIGTGNAGVVDNGPEVAHVHDDVEAVFDFEVLELVNLYGYGCTQRLFENLLT